ncbi:Phage tail protein [compost metagenome]
MIKLSELSLLDVLPDNLRTDKQVRDAAMALDVKMDELTAKIQRVNLFGRTDWTDEETDELAWQFHVDYYDPTLPLEQRRELVRQSIPLHRRKGTPSAVEDLVTTIFGYGKVEEWWEYGDDPGYFQVVVSNPKATEEQAQQFIEVVESVKRKSAHLRRVVVLDSAKGTHYYGVGTQQVDLINLRQVN